jgi:hypothetical protein
MIRIAITAEAYEALAARASVRQRQLRARLTAANV